MTRFILPLFVLFLLSSCSEQSPSILDEAYKGYLTPIHQASAEQALEKDIAFWMQKEKASPGNTIYNQKIAGLLAARFDLQKDIEDLHESDKILESIDQNYPPQVGILHALAANCITQHRFNDALEYAARAYDIGEKKQASQLLMADVFLEKGDKEQAALLLEELGDKHRFDLQIRYVKLYDAQGDLDTAVETMEAALANAEATKNKGLITWSLSNLADMYGHQGRVQKSYEYYLKTLNLDPGHSHSLKGIGWIAYSHDKDYDEAIRIWNSLYEIQPDPELEILLSEAFEMKGDKALAKDLRNRFIADVSDYRYGNMYGSYLIDPLSLDSPSQGLALAKADIGEREHPVTYAHYALALHRAGQSSAALDILQTRVISKTEEPDAYYISGIILEETGESEEADKMLKEALAASYELGPSVTADVQERLKRL